MDRIIKNYEEPLVKAMSFKQFAKHMNYNRKMRREIKRSQKNNTVENHSHTGQVNNGTENIPPENIKIVSLALIVDDIVVDVINAQDKFAEFLQKNPKFIVIEENETRPGVGWAYKDEKFVPFSDVINAAKVTRRG